MLIRTILTCITLSIMLACSASKGNSPTTNVAIPSASATPAQSATKQMTPQEIARVCDRLPQIKIVPLDGGRGRDEVFDAFMEAGEPVVPCLIDKVTDATVIRNPFEFSRYAGYEIRRGDVAFFLILYMKDLTADQFLPDQLKVEYQTEGLYTYFKYVDSQTNRGELKKSLRNWYQGIQK